MNAVIAAAACDELFADREFALRHPSSDALVRYFTTRGVAVNDALVLAFAYAAGAEHCVITFDRALDRAGVK
jgi:predicted nucleic acid-binding protein